MAGALYRLTPVLQLFAARDNAATDTVLLNAHELSRTMNDDQNAAHAYSRGPLHCFGSRPAARRDACALPFRNARSRHLFSWLSARYRDLRVCSRSGVTGTSVVVSACVYHHS